MTQIPRDDRDLESDVVPQENPSKYADDLFMDAILCEAFAKNPGDADRRIDSLLVNLTSTPLAAKPDARTPEISSRRRSWLVSAITVAASIVGLAMVWLANEATLPSAMAAVELAKRQAVRPVDRHYRVRVESPALKAIHADLYLRGADDFTMHIQGPLNVTAWVGSNGDQAWFAPAIGPVIRAHDFEPLRDRLAEMATIPFPLLRIAEVLESLSKNYDLNVVGEETLDGLGQTRWQQILATKQPGFRPLLPATVRLWADPETGDVGKLVLQWTGQVENFAVDRIEFLLADRQNRPHDWYTSAAHHEPSRPVIDLMQPEPIAPQ